MITIKDRFGDVLPRETEGSPTGTHIQTGNRMDMMHPQDGDDPRVQLWLTPWLVNVQIPVCDIDSLISALTDYKERYIIGCRCYSVAGDNLKCAVHHA